MCGAKHSLLELNNKRNLHHRGCCFVHACSEERLSKFHCQGIWDGKHFRFGLSHHTWNKNTISDAENILLGRGGWRAIGTYMHLQHFLRVLQLRLMLCKGSFSSFFHCLALWTYANIWVVEKSSRVSMQLCYVQWFILYLCIQVIPL